MFFFTLLLALASSGTASASGPYDSASVHFAQMMITHHQQAVLISRWALKQGNNSALKKLASRIVGQQSSEIQQMKKWIPSNESMGMEMTMQGIVDPTDLAMLKAARGKKFDGLYLVDMTLHHQGAIAMATPLLKSTNPEVATLCKSIVSTQKVEIEQMRRIMVTGK